MNFSQRITHLDVHGLPLKKFAKFFTTLALSLCLTACDRNSSSLSPPTDADQSDPRIALKDRPTWNSMDDPALDGWDTEDLAAETSLRLKLIGNSILSPDSAPKASSLIDSNFSGTTLIPTNTTSTSIDQTITVSRLHDNSSFPLHQGSVGFAALLKNAQASFYNSTDSHFSAKIIDIQIHQETNRFSTEQHITLSAKSSRGITEQHATWQTEWTRQSDGKHLLRSIQVTKFQQSSSTAQPLFSDCTTSVLGKNPSLRKQLAVGLNDWLERLPVSALLNNFGTPGLALGDADGDGLDDLYLCQEPGLPNLLFLQNPDGTLRDASKEWKVDWLDDSRSALFLDLDNDGDQDLAVATFARLVIAENIENQGFKVRHSLPASESTSSLSSADYDRDGLLDLYICGYADNQVLREDRIGIGNPNRRFVYHDDDNGAKNHFYRNCGSLQFEDITKSSGLDTNNRRWSFAASWEDFDNDGDQDLYVANDYGRNNLYRNDTPASGPPTFTDIAAESKSEDSASGMSATWGDYDRDGHMDLYISNMFSAAGSRVTTQQQFKPDASAETRDRLRRFTKGNSLLRNRKRENVFDDVSTSSDVTIAGWAWGSGFMDLNNDGWEDLVVGNGYLTGIEQKATGDL